MTRASPSGRTTSCITPVLVSLWTSATVSQSSGVGWMLGRVPTGASTKTGSSSHGAPAAALANLFENSPSTWCWERCSISPCVAMSQKAVAPPLATSTS